MYYLFSNSIGRVVFNMAYDHRSPGQHKRLRNELQSDVRSGVRYRRNGKNEKLQQRMHPEIGELHTQNEYVIPFVVMLIYNYRHLFALDYQRTANGTCP